MRNLYDGVPLDEVYKASILAARTLIEKDPDYTFATARLLLHTIFKEILGREVTPADTRRKPTPTTSRSFIKKGVDNELLDEKLLQYDLTRLGAALKAERDLKFDYLGLQTLYDRYFLHVRKTPHRAAAGLLHARGHGPGAQRDRPRSARHRVLRSAVVASTSCRRTPTLFNAGTLRSQLSSLLPDHRAGRPGRHLRVDQGKRAAVQVRRRPGQRLDARARARLATSRAPTANRRAWCRS